jgi:hypothetical protein
MVTSAAFIGSVFGNLLFSAFLLTLQLAEDRRLRDLHERTKKARRLRDLQTDEEVTLQKLTPLDKLLPQLHPHTEHEGIIPRAGPFHIFLSHNWQHGQSAMRIVKVRLLELLPDASVFLDVNKLRSNPGRSGPVVLLTACALAHRSIFWVVHCRNPILM